MAETIRTRVAIITNALGFCLWLVFVGECMLLSSLMPYISSLDDEKTEALATTPEGRLRLSFNNITCNVHHSSFPRRM